MKKLVKILSVVLCITALAAVFAIPTLAAETTAAPQIQFNTNFNANEVVRTIFNWLIGIIALVGAGIGGWHIASGARNQDPKETTSGIVTIVISLAVGGLILIVLNMILA